MNTRIDISNTKFESATLDGSCLRRVLQFKEREASALNQGLKESADALGNIYTWPKDSTNC